MTLRLLVSILGILFITHISFAAPTIQFNSKAKFITVADIHFDPFAACENQPRPCAILQKLRQVDYQQWDSILATQDSRMANYQEDTNYPLLQSTVRELQKINHSENPEFVLVLGDFLAHHFKNNYQKYSRDKSSDGYKQFTRKTLQFLTYKLNQAFPTVNVYPTLGNNDTYTGNYNVVPQGEFLHDTANTWSTLIKNKKNQHDFLRTFSEAGYYTIELPNNQKIIILNTVLFSPKKTNKVMAVAAKNQLKWLKEQLLLAQQDHTHVYLACHIPMGVDVFTSIKLYLFSIQEFWLPQYSRDFQLILHQFTDTIIAILPAHIHMDAYQFIVEDHIPVIFTPSISPVYGNNPGFKVFTYDPKTLYLINYVTYYYPYNPNQPNHWQLEYSFNQIYQPHCKNCDILNGITKITANNALAADFKLFYAVGQTLHPIKQNNDWRPYYWCNINNIDKASYKMCLRQEESFAN